MENTIKRGLTYITGASSGIGLAIKKESAKRGFDVEDFSLDNGYDFSKETSIDKLILEIKKNKPQILFLNAGIASFKKYHEENYKSILKMFEVNVIANIAIISQLHNEIKNGMKIVVTLSTASFINGVHESVYNTTKKALKEYIISINTEFKVDNINNEIFMFIPHKIEGTLMTSNKNTPTKDLEDIINNLYIEIEKGSNKYIPRYEEVYKNVFKKYKEDPIKQGIESVEYRRRRNDEK